MATVADYLEPFADLARSMGANLPISKQVGAITAVLNALTAEGVAENIRFSGRIGRNGHRQTVRASVSCRTAGAPEVDRHEIMRRIGHMMAKEHGALNGEICCTISGKPFKVTVKS